MSDIDPPGTYRPQYRFRWRRLVHLLGHLPALKAFLAEQVRRVMTSLFEPGIVTTERVVEYPFVFQNLDGESGLILDMGCCHSRLPIALASRGFKTIGLDFSPYPFRHPNMLAVRGDAMRSPFATASFGAILAISVIEHVGIGHYHDPVGDRGDRATVKEIARLLRPGGRALITVPCGHSRVDTFQRIYEPAEVRDLLEALSVIRVEYAWSPNGLWTPCTEADARTMEWEQGGRAVALAVATTKGSQHAHRS